MEQGAWSQMARSKGQRGKSGELTQLRISDCEFRIGFFGRLTADLRLLTSDLREQRDLLRAPSSLLFASSATGSRKESRQSLSRP